MHDVVYEGLHVRYAGAHGFGGAGAKRVTIRGCDVSWIGGAYHYRDDAGNGVRFGNGIEFWGDAEDVLVESNRVWEVWDAALSNQSSEKGSVQRNIVWRGNDIRRAEYSYEYWQQGEGAQTSGIVFADNVCREAGKGWGHRQRWNPNAAHLMFYDNTADTREFVVSNNVFSGSENVLLRMFNDWRAALVFADNRWEPGPGAYGRWHGRPAKGLRWLYPDRLDRVHADDASEIEADSVGSRVFGKDDRAAFLAFLGEKPCGTCPETRTKKTVFDTFPLAKMDLTKMSCGSGQARKCRANEGAPLTLGGKTYTCGVGTHAPSRFEVAVDGKGLAFTAVVGIDGEVAGEGSAEFLVYGDGRLLARSGILHKRDGGRPLFADLSGVQVVELVVTDGGDGIACDHADWCNAVFRMVKGAKPNDDLSDRSTQLGILTPPPARAPRINTPAFLGVRPGREILYRVPVAGERPLKATLAPVRGGKMPKGLIWDAETRIIRGRLARPGDYPFVLTAANAAGRAVKRFTIRAGEKIALTPPMGWSSWNAFYDRVTDKKVREQADALIATGLADHGYRYVNIDDFWSRNNGERGKGRPELNGPERAADGTILPSGAFPDMKDLADYVHAKGLQIGIYSSPGPKTCGGCEGSYGHERQDVKTWCNWGFDYVKYDWCSYGEVAFDGSYEEKLRHPYELMGRLLAEADRDIVFSICQYGMGEVWTWGAAAGGQCWRTTGDVWDGWVVVGPAIEKQARIGRYTAPGAWNDPDMLVLKPDHRQCGLTPNEQYAHVSMWAMTAAPLLIGCDMTALDDFMRALLTNDEVIDIDQDALGRGAEVAGEVKLVQVWTRPLADGGRAVALFNPSRADKTVTVDFAAFGLPTRGRLRDVWRQVDLPPLKDGHLKTTVFGHAANLYRIYPMTNNKETRQ